MPYLSSSVGNTVSNLHVLVIGLDPYRVPGPWNPKAAAPALLLAHLSRARARVEWSHAALNHIVIDDPVVSAQHAIVLKVGDFYRLKDLHSTNGTQVNGVSITDAELKDADEIGFGSVKAVFAEASRKAWPKRFRRMLQSVVET